jgi:arylsulfatase A-like enzyme
LSGLERGVDFHREDWAEFSLAAGGGGNYRESSRFLQEAFWGWREAYPGAPYWAHFQTTDVHAWVTAGPAPLAGLFISAERRETLKECSTRVDAGDWPEVFEQAGVNRVAYAAAQRDVYDEAMAHQDYQIGQLVERLKARGEWEHTLLIVAADHSVSGANQDWGILMRDTLPSAWRSDYPGAPIFRSGVSRIPLIVVWPERIAAGQRFSDPVSMIDMLPTILDLADLPMPQVMQGQSLAPLLLGEAGWEPRPVILDEFNVDGATGELRGKIEIVDGRWGASLEINPNPNGPPDRRRPTPLLLFDLWNDPMAVYPQNDEQPELVEKYTEFLEAQFEAHQALGQLFTPSESVALTPEQLETLRALGYIQ